MKWLSVLALCAALFIAATHASQLQEEEGMMDRAAEERLLRILLGNKVDAENENEIDLADEEVAVNKGTVTRKLGMAQNEASSQCFCIRKPCRCSSYPRFRIGRWEK